MVLYKGCPYLFKNPYQHVILFCIVISTCAHNYFKSLIMIDANIVSQDSSVFCSIDTSEYIADLWRNPNPVARENLKKFENVRYIIISVLGIM